MTIPILLYHEGTSACLSPMMEAAHRYSPNTPVTIVPEHHSDLWNDFQKVFKNFSSNPPEMELLWFKRWFMVLEHCHKMDIDKFWCLDWDVLLFTDLTLEPDESSVPGQHVGYFDQQNHLYDWLRWVHHIYEEPPLINAFRELWDMGCPLFETIGDMTLGRWYGRYSGLRDLCKVADDHTVFDHNLSSRDGFEMRDQQKVITFENGQPFGRHFLGKVRFKALHCWSPQQKASMQTILNQALASCSTSPISPSSP